MFTKRIILAAMLLSSAPCTYAQTEAKKVDVELVLALDVSRSVNQKRLWIQQEGYAAAFRDPSILLLIQAGRYHSIAVTVVIPSPTNHWTQTAIGRILVSWQQHLLSSRTTV